MFVYPAYAADLVLHGAAALLPAVLTLLLVDGVHHGGTLLFLYGAAGGGEGDRALAVLHSVALLPRRNAAHLRTDQVSAKEVEGNDFISSSGSQ